MKQLHDQELHDLAAAIEQAEGLDPRALRSAARGMLADLQRQVHRWDGRAFRAGNTAAIDVTRN